MYPKITTIFFQQKIALNNDEYLLIFFKQQNYNNKSNSKYKYISLMERLVAVKTYFRQIKL